MKAFQSSRIVVISKMILELLIPFVHSVNLIIVVFLTGTGAQVSFCPFSETSGNLFGSLSGVSAVIPEVISIEIKVGIPPSYVMTSWTAVKGLGVIISASLVTTFEIFLHATSILSKFGDPFFLRREKIVPVSENFFRKFNKSVESLKWVSWRIFFLV